ncbi:ABC transporter permease [Mucilaginibacter panaciglaebae]|uniref:Transport permease protein n=1 Tax=Mucilaginibacter panaciglaebae TaxID=502331 RepID=A0ABP7WUQ6_9SPHI
MNQKYSNLKATLAIAKASFRSIVRSPSSVVFTLLFPLIFILVFGFISGGGVISVDVGVAKTNDTINPVYQALKKVSVVRLIHNQTPQEMEANLKKGSIDAILNIQKNAQPPYFTVNVQSSKASGEKMAILKSALNNIFFEINSRIPNAPPPVAELKETTVVGREYKTIDFILPGQLGFALLSTGVFGTAFVFLSLRITLVIKRFFATPVKRYSIVIGEAIARISFALIGALFIITIGRFAFGFTLVHGFVTVLDMLLLSLIGVVVFMGFGFVVSGIAKNESTVPPIANMITLPQFLLSGTFFSINVFPAWLQPISRALPLTYLNDALRKVAFEGASLMDVSHQILIMLIWGVVVYIAATKAFKWE